MFLRLRQLCLVARDLAPVVQHLEAVFDIAVCHRDPAVARFGLENALLPVGTSFIEIVAPITDGTTAGRYLERRHGDGGYMVILDSEDLERWRERIAAAGVRIAADLATEQYRGLQLHPRDTGGALLEINWTRHGAALDGAYAPAGKDWQRHVRTGLARAIVGAELQSDDPQRLAQRWGDLLQRPVERDPAGGYQIQLDNARVGFTAPHDERGEGLAAITVEVTDPAAVLRRARQRGLGSVNDPTVSIGGVRFHLVGSADPASTAASP